tara:strand:+ start:5788 stop:6177 length:390 start_codon:yes stop_codon:yes gene_type:complete
MDLSKIPKEIIDKYIIPYTYMPQSPDLLKDIKTYHCTLKKMFDMYYNVYQDHPSGKEGIHRLLKVKINYYLYEIEKIRNNSYIKKIVWQIPLPDDRAELYLIRRMWGFISPLIRLKCMTHYYRFFISPL